MTHKPEPGQDQSGPFKRRLTALGICALVAWIALWYALPGDLPFFNDQNAYLGGAASLKAGHGYRFEPYINLPKIGMYPPGYSAWLAIFWNNSDTIEANSRRLEIANWIAAGFALFALAVSLSLSRLSLAISSAVVLLTGTSLIFTQSVFGLGADVLFAAGTYLLAILMAAYNPDRRVTAWWIVVGLLTAVLFVIKTAALAYIAGLGLFGLIRGDLRRLSRLLYFALPTGSLIALWFLFTRNIPNYGSFFRVQLAKGGGFGYVLNVLQQAWLYFSGRWLVELFLNPMDRLRGAHALARVSFAGEALAVIVGLALVLPIVIGIRESQETPYERMTLLVMAAVALQFLSWPYYLGARGGMALIPFLADWLAKGLRWKLARGAVLAVFLLNLPGNVWLSYKTIRSEETEGRARLAALQQAANWINQTTGGKAILSAGRDVPLAHLVQYLGPHYSNQRLLANATPMSEGDYVDVTPREQGNQWADYVIRDPDFDPQTWSRVRDRYEIRSQYGPWIVASPRR